MAARREQSPSYEVGDYVKTGRASAAYGGKRNLDWWMDNGPAILTVGLTKRYRRQAAGFRLRTLKSALEDKARRFPEAPFLWFEDAEGRMNEPLGEREVLCVSQFTLYGDTRKGRRPSFVAAARPEQAEPLVGRVVEELRALGAGVATGRFRADMAVDLVNDGPVTLVVDV